MSDPTLSADDLATYLGRDVDTDRATALIRYAWQLCETIVAPLPAGGQSVVLDVVARAYLNPQNVKSETIGPYSAQFPTVSGGLWLTRANKSTLRRLAGRGGGFTIETCPDTAGQGLPWWDAGRVPVGDPDVALSDWDPAS